MGSPLRVFPNIPVMNPGDTPPQSVPVTLVAGGGSGGTSDPDEAAFTVGSTQGTPIMGVVNPVDTPTAGKLAVAALDASRRLQIAGSFSSTPVQSNTVSAITSPATIGTTAVTALAANASRKRLTLHNVGTTVFFILFGAGTPSPTNYHIALRAGGTANDGSSELYVDDMWIGAVQAVSSAAGGSLAIAEFI